MPGPGEWGTKGLHVGCLGTLLKAPVPWHQDQNTQDNLEGPSSSLGTRPPDSNGGFGEWDLGHCLSTQAGQLHPGHFPS